MTNDMISKKQVLMAATMLLAITFVATMPLLVPTTIAFAQQEEGTLPDVDAILQGVNIDSQSEEQQSSSESETGAAASADEEEQQGSSESDAVSQANPANSEMDIDAEEEAEISTTEEDDPVNVNPITQTEVQSDANVNADIAVVDDEEECDEATNESTQGIGQGSNQITGSQGQVGDNSIYVSPKTQFSAQSAINVNADFDIVLTEGCEPEEDTVSQVIVQQSGQGVGNDLEASSEGSTTIVPVQQRSEQISESIGINDDIILPVL
jgi:hypothetical protein